MMEPLFQVVSRAAWLLVATGDPRYANHEQALRAVLNGADPAGLLEHEATTRPTDADLADFEECCTGQVRDQDQTTYSPSGEVGLWLLSEVRRLSLLELG